MGTKRRLVAKLSLALFCLLQIIPTANAQRRPRQHIVLFISDDYSWHDSGVYGTKYLGTPNLDELARQGMRFDAAFGASPTCTPSRSAIYTGLFPFRNGAHANHSLIRDGLRTLPQRMMELGYRVVLAGKTHIGPRSSFPFEYLVGSNIMPEGKNHLLWTDLNTEAIDRLLAEHDIRRPLLLVVCSHSPHVYWPNNQTYSLEKIHPPPYLLDTKETREALASYYTDVSLMDQQMGAVRQSLKKHGYERETLFLYTSDQGAQFPFAKWNLYDAGIRVPLLVSWPGRVRAGSTTKALVSLVDLLPTLVEVARGKRPNELDGQSFLSILLGRSRGPRTEVFASHTGDDQMNRSPMRAIRTSHYKLIVNLRPDSKFISPISEAPGIFGLDYWSSWEHLAERDARAAQTVRRYRQRPAEELYDLRIDPWEQRNVVNDPAYRAVLVDLRTKLKAWRLQQGENLDKVPMPEDARRGEIFYAQ